MILHGLTLLLGIGLLAIPALLAPAALRVTGPLAAGLAGLLIAAAVVVLATELLSLAHALQTGWMLALEALAAAGALAGWIAAGRPRPPVAAPPGTERLLAGARADPGAAGMVVVAAVALAVQGLLAVLAVQNNWDAMSYHLARVAYWLQFDSALHFDLGTQRQLAQPPNGEYLQAWTILMSGTDRLSGLVQWLAAAGLGGTVSLGARALGFGRAAAAFAGALWIVLPQPLLQASTTQNDVIAAFLVAAAALFAVRGVRLRSLGELAVAGLALGLAVGAKGTVLPALPSIGLLAAAAVAAYRPPWRLVASGAAIAVVAVLLLGTLNYAQNLDTYSDPAGGLVEQVDRDSEVGGNAVRIGWAFVDSPGTSIPWLETAAARTVEAVFGDVRSRFLPELKLKTRVHEDVTAYGLLGMLLLGVLVVALVRLRSPRSHRIVAAAALLFLVIFAATSAHNPWVARVVMPGMALGAPLLALLYRSVFLRAAAVSLAVLGLVPVLAVNELKRVLPPEGERSIFALNRAGQQTLTRPEAGFALDALRARIRPDTPIGLVRGGDSWDYAFFGPNRSRRVVPLAEKQATPATMRSERLGGIVFANVGRPPARLRAEEIGTDYWFVRAPGS